MCRKGNSNMLSVNSNPTNAMAFKGKPSAKDLKKAEEAAEIVVTAVTQLK